MLSSTIIVLGEIQSLKTARILGSTIIKTSYNYETERITQGKAR